MVTIVTVIAVQFVLTFVVIVVLKKLWDKELIRAAIEKLEGCKAASGVAVVDVCCASAISGEFKSRLEAVCQRKFAQAQLNIHVDPSLKGGVVITLGDQSFDFSLSSR